MTPSTDWVIEALTLYEGRLLRYAKASQGKDRGGYRDEFVSLVQKAIALSARPSSRR